MGDSTYYTYVHQNRNKSKSIYTSYVGTYILYLKEEVTRFFFFFFFRIPINLSITLKNQIEEGLILNLFFYQELGLLLLFFVDRTEGYTRVINAVIYLLQCSKV
jgi:hypothetical protein